MALVTKTTTVVLDFVSESLVAFCSNSKCTIERYISNRETFQGSRYCGATSFSGRGRTFLVLLFWGSRGFFWHILCQIWDLWLQLSLQRPTMDIKTFYWRFIFYQRGPTNIKIGARFVHTPLHEKLVGGF